MKRALQLLLSIMAVVSGITLYNVVRDAQWAHSRLTSALVFLPEIGTIVAVIELHHSAKANELRNERNQLAKENNNLEEARNRLAEENNQLQRQLQTDRNEHLAEIAKQIQRPQSTAQQNAAKLRQYLGKPVVMFNGDDSRWPSTPLIAEVSETDIVALFQPMQQGSQASVVYASCGDLEIIEVARGACPLQIKVNRRYGNAVQLGEITRWEDRRTRVAVPVFDRGDSVYNARFTKQGSSETRTLFIYSSRDGANSFLLETSTGEQFVGDNKAVSIRFLSQQVEYLSDGFQRTSMGTGGGTFPLFVC